MLALAACNDSPVCVFTTGCQSGSGAISGNGAVLPIDGQLIVDGPPEIVQVFPSGANNAATTPIVVFFSESMAPESLENSVVIAPLFGGIPSPPLGGIAQVLTGDGRVLVLLPGDLDVGDYRLEIGPDSVATDLTGQELSDLPGSQLINFAVADTAPDEPQLVMTYPADDARNQSETSELVVVFDRPIRESSVTPASFSVEVDGAPPVPNPPPAPIVVPGGGGAREDLRVFLYQSVDGAGVPVPLGTDAAVELVLSPFGSPIQDSDNDNLAATTVTFTTLSFAPAVGASLLSDPFDAIGIANLTDGNPEELQVEVELDGALDGDSVDLILFGEQKSAAPDPPLIAIQRTIRLTGTAPIDTALFLREDIGLTFSDDPSDARFNDGPLAFAFRTRRGTIVAPVRLLDLDPAAAVIQDPVLDTTAPTITTLLVPGASTASFRSDQRGISIAGDANEALRSVEVVTPLGNNGTLSPVVGSDANGLFLAAPVDAGILATGTTTYSIVAFDSALNASPVVTGDFTQVGVVGGAALAPGGTITVEVFDQRTLAPLVGADVFVHSDDGAAFALAAQGVTGPDGRVALVTGGAPSVGAIVSVRNAGYDLFTLHGAPTTFLSVPLRTITPSTARAAGNLVSANAAAVALLPGMERRFDDSRRGFELPRGFVGQNTLTGAGTITVPYGPEAVQEGRLGMRAFYAGDFLQTELAFSATQLLQAFALRVPFDRAAPGALQPGDLTLEFLLTDAGAPPAEVAVGLPAIAFEVDPASGVDTGALFDDLTTSGAPFVTVECLVAGAPGALAVAQGLAFDAGVGAWTVRAAEPGAITAAGSLGGAGVVQGDPFVRMELRDTAGNAAGARPRLGEILAGLPTPTFRALDVPALLAPAAKSSTGGQAFTLLLEHAIGDDRTEGGLYRVVLQDDVGRRWTLWRVDPAGVADIALRVPDLGVGLADGPIVASPAAFAWDGFGVGGFLWSDVERLFELFAFATPVSFQKP